MKELQCFVNEVYCFLIDPQNFLHPTAPYFRQKQKVRFVVLLRIWNGVGVEPEKENDPPRWIRAQY